MKIEYLNDGCSDCPLIRIYGNEPPLIKQLVDIFDKLHHGEKTIFALHDLAGFDTVANLKLFAKLGRKDDGVLPLKDKNSFQLSLTSESWAQVADLTRPFCKPAVGVHFQWLDETAKVSLLITTSDEGLW